MKQLLIILLTLCTISVYSQTLTVTKQGNTVVFSRSGQEPVAVGANEYFDCYRYSDTTKITFAHNRLEIIQVL